MVHWKGQERQQNGSTRSHGEGTGTVPGDGGDSFKIC